jgi:hypothetical protein
VQVNEKQRQAPDALGADDRRVPGRDHVTADARRTVEDVLPPIVDRDPDDETDAD